MDGHQHTFLDYAGVMKCPCGEQMPNVAGDVVTPEAITEANAASNGQAVPEATQWVTEGQNDVAAPVDGSGQPEVAEPVAVAPEEVASPVEAAQPEVAPEPVVEEAPAPVESTSQAQELLAKVRDLLTQVESLL